MGPPSDIMHQMLSDPNPSSNPIDAHVRWHGVYPPPLNLPHLIVALLELFGFLVIRCRAFDRLWEHEHAAGGSFGQACLAQLLLRRHKDVGNVVVLAEHGERGDDIYGGDVAGKDAEPAGGEGKVSRDAEGCMWAW